LPTLAQPIFRKATSRTLNLAEKEEIIGGSRQSAPVRERKKTKNNPYRKARSSQKKKGHTLERSRVRATDPFTEKRIGGGQVAPNERGQKVEMVKSP